MKHPNATVGAVTGSGLGSLLVWLLSLADVDMSPEAAAAVAGGVATLALLIGRNGIRGLLGLLWRGSAS